MPHKTENEESVTVPETTITLCVNCGVATNYSSSNNNSCQKCLNSCSSNINQVFIEKSSLSFPCLQEKNISSPVETSQSVNVSIFSTKRVVNRCTGCRKKVGLTGFKCRCGDLFCADHRYSDRHDCSFDYKAAGREVIKRENPVVKASKIIRI